MKEQVLQIDGFMVTKADLLTLANGAYVNDQIINAYIALLMKRCGKTCRDIFIAGTQFFTKMRQVTKTEKGESKATGGVEQACRWYKNTKILSYRWLIIPVHNDSHWSLVAILNISEWFRLNTPGFAKLDNLKTNKNVPPLIVSIDSIRRSNKALVPVITRFLATKWIKELAEANFNTKNLNADKMSQKMLADLPVLRARVPRQENSFDCGVFLLHYLELLIKGNTAKIIEVRPRYWFRKGLEDWFKPENVTNVKRKYLREVLTNLKKMQGTLGSMDAAVDSWNTCLDEEEATCKTSIASNKSIETLAQWGDSPSDDNSFDDDSSLSMHSSDGEDFATSLLLTASSIPPTGASLVLRAPSDPPKKPTRKRKEKAATPTPSQESTASAPPKRKRKDKPAAVSAPAAGPARKKKSIILDLRAANHKPKHEY